MADMDFTRLNTTEKKEILLRYITALKQTQRKRQILKEELDLWTRRTQLAKEKNRADLQSEAEIKKQDAETELASIREQERQLQTEITALREKLKSSPLKMEIDTDQLLAELELLVGEPDLTSEDFKKLESELALKELKKKMGREE